ncbi:lipoprotein [Arenicella chitinivorans]|uniref:Lipoprotein n=1 Tax=Arenicella chitinivorans TaxID=1329800 RepID=A0A918S0X0_9GAMM|nr:lipoprotein [Arenicella chitinivorans]
MAIKIKGKQTVEQVIETYGLSTRDELAPLFDRSGITYPPKKLALVAFKDTNVLEVWASNEGSNYQLIVRYPIKAASGKLGPKLREGDRQVPEGIYTIIGLNPNSAYHLSMKINYPNAYDLEHAKAEGRAEPGTNIFIHGRAASIGCLAMGDPVIEKLFSLVYATGRDNTTVLISPTDPSKNPLVVPSNAPEWTRDLYDKIEAHYQTINSNRYNSEYSAAKQSSE